MGVSEAEVLELTQRWSDLCDRESFNLLAVERAVHEVTNGWRCVGTCSANRLCIACVLQEETNGR